MMKRFILAMICIFCFFSPVQAYDAYFGDRLAALPSDLSKALAELNLPDKTGAMGRNRSGYFHVRFQMGLHHLAHHAIATKNATALRFFISAMEYSLAHQTGSGDFRPSVPQELATLDQPSDADLVSGVAFFASSAGSGMYTVETSTWVQQAPQLKPLRKRVARAKIRLRRTLNFLTENSAVLEAADQYAPNRLLFDAMAFYTLGEILDHEASRAVAERFLQLAIEQIHPEGYFIEAGGYDSSYNGVSTALALRLVLMGASDDLAPIAQHAMKWQKSRIAPSGEILTEGNTRVHPGGESFLGRRKDVDVGHTLEALMLSSTISGDAQDVQLARRVLDYYRNKSKN